MDLASRRSTLVFVGDIIHIISLVSFFQALGIDARGLHSKLSHEERRIILDDFRAAKFQVLVNCG